MSQLVLTRMTIVEFEFSLIEKNHKKTMNNSFLLTGIKYIILDQIICTNTWVCLGIFWDIWTLIVSGSRFQGSFFSFGQWVFYRGKFYVGGRLWPSGVVGIVGRGAGWWRHKLITELWGLDRSNQILPQSKSFPVWPWGFMVWRCQSSATKLKLLQRLGFLEMWHWRFWGRFCGVSTGTISAVSHLGGVKKLVFVDDV